MVDVVITAVYNYLSAGMERPFLFTLNFYRIIDEDVALFFRIPRCRDSDLAYLNIDLSSVDIYISIEAGKALTKSRVFFDRKLSAVYGNVTLAGKIRSQKRDPGIFLNRCIALTVNSICKIS